MPDGRSIVDIGEGRNIVLHIVHSDGVPAGFGKDVLQPAAAVGGGGGLLRRFGQRFGIRRGADKQRHIFRVEGRTHLGRACADDLGGKFCLVANLHRSCRNGHVNQGVAVLVVRFVVGQILKDLGGIITAGSLNLDNRLANASQPHIVAFMKLNVCQLLGMDILQAVAFAIDIHGNHRLDVAEVLIVIRKLHIGCVKSNLGRFDRVRNGGMPALERKRTVFIHSMCIRSRAALPALGILGGKVVDIAEGNRNINIADQPLAGGFQRVDVAGKALQHIHVCPRAADDGVLHILLQRGIGVCVGLPRSGSIVACLHLRRIIGRQQRVHFRFPAAVGLIGFVVPLGIDQRVRVCGGGKAFDLGLFARRVLSRRISFLVKEAVHQCLPLRFRGGIGAPCTGGAVIGTDRFIVCVYSFWIDFQLVVVIPVDFRRGLFIECSGISLRDGDEFGNSGLQIRKSVVYVCLCIKCTLRNREWTACFRQLVPRPMRSIT